MPFVRVYYTSYFKRHFWLSSSNLTPDELLQRACEEIVPVGMNSPMGPLAPGDIVYVPTMIDSLKFDVVFDVEAFRYDDRLYNLDDRSTAMKAAFEEIFPGCSIAMHPKLVLSAWLSDTEDSKFNGPMTMEAAIERYKKRTGHNAIDDD